MRILSVTAGAASMYCGSCLRDNAVAAALIARGHDVTLIPLYTPLRTDEENVARRDVLFGGINIYLQHQSAFFRRLPRFLDRLLDSQWLIRTFADRSVSVEPKLLGGLTVSMLEGTTGVLKKEFDKLLDWLKDEPRPDVVTITNSMLIGLAKPLSDALGAPVCCTLQGEALFLDGLTEPFRSRAIALIQSQVRHVTRFIAVSEFEARFMTGYLRIPAEKIAVVPLGVQVKDFTAAAPSASPASSAPPRSAPLRSAPLRSAPLRSASSAPSASSEVFTVGFLGRIAPEKGLHVLAEAFVLLRKKAEGAAIRLEAAGYMAAGHKPYLAQVQRALERAGVSQHFTYHGEVDRRGKVRFLHEVDVLSMPATYDEPKGFPLLEAMACGVPVVQPRRGAFVEIVEKTEGGLLVAPDDPEDLAEALHGLWSDRELRQRLGRQGREGVRRHYTIESAAQKLIGVYEGVVLESSGAGARSARLEQARER
jgi:glycosyltransferase involved in cell wall biosynthesis